MKRVFEQRRPHRRRDDRPPVLSLDPRDPDVVRVKQARRDAEGAERRDRYT